MAKILLTTVCDNGYALGAQVMIYSMSKNIKGFDACDVKVYYNDTIAPLSEENKNRFKAIGNNIIELKDTEDSFASAANYIKKIGWIMNKPCFYKVELKEGIPTKLKNTRRLNYKNALETWNELQSDGWQLIERQINDDAA